MIDKVKFHDFCLHEIEKRLAKLKAAINELHEDKSKETKSSVGDKYETGRAMIQQEEKQLNQQLMVAVNLKTQLSLVNPEKKHESIALGSIVVTDRTKFYLSASIGKIVFQEQEIFCLSQESPLGRLLTGKHSGDTVNFKGNKFRVLEIQ